MKNIGVIEGFFGPAWPEEDRNSYADFLASAGASFYIYAPKQDPHLRKAWREDWDENYLSKLSDLCSHFQKTLQRILRHHTLCDICQCEFVLKH